MSKQAVFPINVTPKRSSDPSNADYCIAVQWFGSQCHASRGAYACSEYYPFTTHITTIISGLDFFPLPPMRVGMQVL
ncbi:hypothetical protein GJ744_006591 [Endocarpon pusillum]|uniref:Uncharacterized protein n=1 Tax=Endocarpon pusillum TaxID=364733 RepID=A0A8H7ATC8_9EURO|nr:hypothetical protein GJ744_006591 [Endocarpon pusillum]